MHNNTFKYSFILPLIWLNVLLGNQIAYPSLSLLGQIINWLLLSNILLIVILNGIKNNKILFVLIIFSIIAKTIYLLGFKSFNIFYLILYSLIFIFFSRIFYDKAFNIFKKQILFFLKISVPIMFFQLYGSPQFLQKFNTLYVVEVSPDVYEFPDFETLSLLFKKINIENWGYETEITSYLSMQVRPPGLLHSSAMQAPLVLASSIFVLSSLLKRKLNYKDSIISLAVILCGAKIALYGFLFILFFAYLNIKIKEFRKSVFKLFSYLLFYLLLYYFLFPLAFYQNFSISSLNGSLFFRLIDFFNVFGGSFISILSENFSNLSDLSDSYDIIASKNNNDAGTLSGLIYIFYSLPLIILIYLIFKKKYIKYIKELNEIDIEKSFVIKFSFIWVIIVLLATPLLGSNLFSIYIGISLYPVLKEFKFSNK